MTSILDHLTGRIPAAATAACMLALSLAACGNSATTFQPVNYPLDSSWNAAAATYIAAHPAPSRPGMSSGILISFSTSAPEAPSTCTIAAGCFYSGGTVVERGGHVVQLLTSWSRHSCASLNAVGEDDYFSWSDSHDKYGCPRSVIIIKRTAITAKDVVSVTPITGSS